jgi:hypothetical protein
MDDSSLKIEVLNLSSGSKFIVLPMNRIIQLFAGLTLVSFYLNLILGCGYMFTCSTFVPSPHYLGSFLGYNRFYVMSCVLLSITLSMTYLTIYLDISAKFNNIENILFKSISAFTCVSVLLVSITNDVNSSHFFPFPAINSTLSYLSFTANIIWLGIVAIKYRAKPASATWLRICTFCFLVGVALWILVLFQRKLNYSTENWFVNTTMWSILEWLLLTVSIVFVALVGNLSGSFKLLLGIDGEKLEAEDQVELTLNAD